MKEQVPAGRGLEDISHYFLTEKKEAVPESEPAQPERVKQETAIKNIFIIGSESSEARAVLASNIACEWSLNRKEVELIESHSQIQNSHFFMGGLSDNNGDATHFNLKDAGSISLTRWEPNSNLFAGKGEWVVWNVNLEATLNLLSGFDESPLFLAVLENDRSKLIQTYIQMKAVLRQNPDARFIAVRYSNRQEKETHLFYEFFQKICRQFLNIELFDGGYVLKDISLAKSILRRIPVVLAIEDNIPAKDSLKKLAQFCLSKVTQ